MRALIDILQDSGPSRNDRCNGISKSSPCDVFGHDSMKNDNSDSEPKLGGLSDDDIPKKESTFPFFDLPAELRNNIYEECLIEERIVIDKRRKPHPLLSVSRQVRDETIPIY